MSDPYVGEIRMFGGSFAPVGWAMCNGATIPISENDTLFTLIGTTYGGDGQETFQLPDLQGRVPIHNGTGPDGSTYVIGEEYGVESVTLTAQQTPLHNHPLVGADVPGEQQFPANNVTARSHTGTVFLYFKGETPTDVMAPAIGPAGGSQPHENLMPYLCITFIISLFGVFPSQT
jgi:microcystin-dependent protein